MIPLYGFLEGDTMGVLILAKEADTIAALADKLQAAAATRVRHRARVGVFAAGRELPLASTVAEAQLTALDRFDVVAARGAV
jgi:hypothetical protein